MREFYALYSDRLAAVCARYVADNDDLKDVLQDCMVKVMTRAAQFTYRGTGSLLAWATRLAVNLSLDFLRNRKRGEWTQLQWDVPDEGETDDPDIHDIPPDAVQEMIRQLPTGYRTVFNLYVFEDKSHKEIASMLGIKENSSASQLHRAKNMLTREIEKYRNNIHSRQPNGSKLSER